MTILDRRGRRSAELRERVRETAGPRPEPATADPESVRTAVAAELDRRDREAEAAERREHEARLRGGPCVFCGVERTRGGRTRPGGPREPRWYTVRAGTCCSWCEYERRHMGLRDGVVLSDEEHRIAVVRRLAGAQACRYWYGTYLAETAARGGLRWWHELDPAARIGGGQRRFAHVDVARLREALAVRSPSRPAYETADPCPRCGCAYMWTRADAGAKPTCHGCAHFRDLAQVVTELVGVEGSREVQVGPPRNASSPLPMGGLETIRERQLGSGPSAPFEHVTTLLDVTWYDGTRLLTWDSRRARTVGGGVVRSRAVNLTPFAYLDLEALRRRAFELLPHERYWRSREVWRRLRARGATTS